MKSRKEPTLSALVEIVKRALLVGGKIVREGGRHKRNVSFKTPLSPVTQIDLASEKAIISIIREKFPHHVFLAEEMAHYDRTAVRSSISDEYRWIIDPLDGTVNFIHRIPQSCVSIAVEKRGKILAGGVFDPYRNELFMAARAKGATMNGTRIQVSREKVLRKALVITGFPYDRKYNSKHYLEFLQPFLKNCADLRRFGAAALDLAWIACGRAETFVEYKLSPWDVAAGMLLVEEAGGKVTDYKNRPLNIDEPYATLATNKTLHKAMVRLLK